MDQVKEQLMGFLAGIGCSEIVDDAVLEYATGVLVSFATEDEDLEDHLEHVDLLLAETCGERYGLAAQEERYQHLTDIVKEARRAHAEPSPSTRPTTTTATSNAHGTGDLTKQLGGLPLGGCGVGAAGVAYSASYCSADIVHHQENVSPAGEPAGVHVAPAVVRELLTLCSGAVSEGFMQYALQHKFAGSAEALAAWLLDCDRQELDAAEAAWEDLCQREAREQEEARLLKERNKQQILQKFDLCPVPQPKDPKKGGKPAALDAWSDKQEKQPKVRFLDGRVVSTKGEKFIIEKTGEEWDGGSRGKVYTKGKRGKGFA